MRRTHAFFRRIRRHGRPPDRGQGPAEAEASEQVEEIEGFFELEDNAQSPPGRAAIVCWKNIYGETETSEPVLGGTDGESRSESLAGIGVGEYGVALGCGAAASKSINR